MKRLLINASGIKMQAALLDRNRVVELWNERNQDEQIVGNIYLGRVTDVLPGMEAAFVDIGLSKHAYLHVKDAAQGWEGNSNAGRERPLTISQLLHQGEAVLVQVKKEGTKQKGPKVTTEISIPGKAFVYLPFAGYIAISRKLTDPQLRIEMKELLSSLCTSREGVIVRTAASQMTPAEMEEELTQLRTLWQEIGERQRSEQAPALVYQDQDFLQRLLRDLAAYELTEIVVDDLRVHKRIQHLIQMEHPQWKGILQLEQGVTDLFTATGVERELERLIERHVWLKSGGFLIIDQTEALTVIDVNTGKYTGKSGLEETIYRTNLEAAGEIARQLRLRDLGGIILIDFIDMKESAHQEELLHVLQEALRADRTRTEIMGITRLGLVEMTRKKTYRSLAEEWLRACPACHGKGTLLQHHVMLERLHRQLKEYERGKHADYISIALHPSLQHYLEKELGWAYWKEHFACEIFWHEDGGLAEGEYKILYAGADQKLAITIR